METSIQTSLNSISKNTKFQNNEIQNNEIRNNEIQNKNCKVPTQIKNGDKKKDLYNDMSNYIRKNYMFDIDMK